MFEKHAIKDNETTKEQPWKKKFFLIWCGQIFSLMGSSVVQFSLIWWLTQMTGSAKVLALATTAGFLPEILLGPFAGALVDRWNRKRVMIAADALVALVTVGLVFLFWTGVEAVWQIYVVMLLRSLGAVFHFAALQASISLMVPEGQLSRVAGLNQSLRGMVNIAGPPLGALLLSLLPFYGALSVDVITAILAIVPLCLVEIPQPENANRAGTIALSGLWADVRQGLRYVWSWPGLRGIIIMAVVINFLFTPAATMLPLLVKNYFQAGAWELSGLESAWGVGIVLGGLGLSVWGGFRRQIITSLVGIVGMGTGFLMVGFAPVHLYPLAVAGFFVSGFMNPIVNGPFFAVIQKKVAPEMQGRVFTMISSLVSAMVPLSMLVAGPLSDLLGVRAWFWIAGGGIMLTGVAAFFVPVIMTMESDSPRVESSMFEAAISEP